MFTKISLYSARAGTKHDHEAAARLRHSTIAEQPGFMGSLLGRSYDDDNQYVEAIQWKSMVHANEAAAVVSTDQRARAWLDYTDLPRLQSWGMKTLGVISRQERSLADLSVGAWLIVRWRTQGNVEPAEHTRNELLMHHEAFAPVQGYLGAVVLQDTEGEDRMELIAWPTVGVARSRVAQILSSGNPLVAQHLADCASGSALHYVDPIVRA